MHAICMQWCNLNTTHNIRVFDIIVWIHVAFNNSVPFTTHPGQLAPDYSIPANLLYTRGTRMLLEGYGDLNYLGQVDDILQKSSPAFHHGFQTTAYRFYAMMGGSQISRDRSGSGRVVTCFGHSNWARCPSNALNYMSRASCLIPWQR